MRIMALDVGSKRIGVAISDALGFSAQPLTVLTRGSLRHDLDVFQELAETHHVEEVVVGLPLSLNGTMGPQAKQVMKFVTALRASLRCPVRTWDERLTTVQGSRALREANLSRRRQKRLIDQVAAQLILQSFLDAKRDTTS